MSTALKEAAAEIRRDIEAAVAEVKAHPRMADIMTAVKALNGLEDMLKEPRTALGDFFGFAASEAVKAPDAAPSVRFDEFFGMEPLEAAKSYLRKRNDAREFGEILEAVRAGGVKVDNEEKVRSGLSRSTLDVVKIGDRYGWIDNYPQVKAQRWSGLRKQAPATKKPADDAKPADDTAGEATSGAASGK